MIRSQTITGSALATSETVLDKLTVPTNKKRVYRQLRFDALTGITIRVYDQQDRILDVFADLPVNDQLPVDFDLAQAAGAELTITAVNSTGGPLTVDVVIFYDEV